MKKIFQRINDFFNPQFKYVYTFTIHTKPKAIAADNMYDAVSKIIERHFSSFCNRHIVFISSNDPEAPKQEMLVYTTGLYDRTRLKPIHG